MSRAKYALLTVLLAGLVALTPSALCRADLADEAAAAVEKAVSNENLRALAANTYDAETLVGYAVLATGDLRDELIERAVLLSPGSKKVTLSMVVDKRFDAATVDALVEADPQNALPYYLKALFLVDQGKAAAAIDELEKGTRCGSFDSHTADIATAVLKAVDTLGLSPRERLLALARVMQWSPWFPARIYKVATLAERLGKAYPDLPPDARTRVPAYLIAAANQMLLSVDNGHYATFYSTKRALKIAYLLMAISSSAKQTDAIVASALNQYTWETGPEADARGQLVSAAFYLLSPVPTVETLLGGPPERISAGARTAFDKVFAQAHAERDMFLVLAENDALDVLTAQLTRGELAAQKLLSGKTQDNPLLAAAAAVNSLGTKLEETAKKVGALDYEAKQMLKIVGLGCLMYSNDYNGSFPPSLDVLVKEGYMQSPSSVKSPATENPFVYVGAALRDDAKNVGTLVLAYDGAAYAGDLRPVLFGDGHVMMMSSEQLEKIVNDQKEALPQEAAVQRLKELGISCLMYAQEHGGDFAADPATLVQAGFARDADVTKSPINGKPFVYVGSGIRNDGTNAPLMERTVIAYDDAKLPDDKRAVLFADGHVKVHSAAELDQFLKNAKN